MSEGRTIEQLGRDLSNLSQQVEVLRKDLAEAFKLLYQHSHSGMVGRASFPGEDGSNESEMRREYAERFGSPLSRIAAVLIDEEEDRMSERLMGKFLEIDWPDEETSHSFVMDTESEEAKFLTDDLRWWMCEKCSGRKLVKTIPADTTGPEERLIMAKFPEDMTSVCPDVQTAGT